MASGKPTRSGARLDARRFNLVGTRAGDSLREDAGGAGIATLVPKKLTATLYAGVALGGVAALSRLPGPDLGMFQIVIAWVLAFAGLVVVTALSSILTRMTFLELSELRPARLREGVQGLTGRTVRLLFALLFAARRRGTAARAALRWATAWLVALYDLPWPLLRGSWPNVFTVASLMLEFALWPLFGLAFLLGPILVVEECSSHPSCPNAWWQLWRQHFRARAGV